jgi:hypothetical protein
MPIQGKWSKKYGQMKSKNDKMPSNAKMIRSKNIFFASVCESIVYKIKLKNVKIKARLVGRLAKQGYFSAVIRKRSLQFKYSALIHMIGKLNISI